MKSIKVKWTGIRPLIMANPQTVQMSNPHSIASRELNAKIKAARKKTDENQLAELEKKQAVNDWEASAYWDKDGGNFFLPDTVIMAAIRSGATAGKKGRDVDRAMIITQTEAV